MKIALVSPYSLYRPNFKIAGDDRINDYIIKGMRFSKAYTPSDSLLQLAAMTPLKHQLVYMDDQYSSINTSIGVDIAAITIFTINADRAYEVAKQFRKKGVYVVVGGIHPTFCPDEALKHADTVVVGDADNIWGQFLKDFESKKAKKIYNGGVGDIQKRSPLKLDLLSRKMYYRNSFNKEVYSLYTSIGCNRFCKFCTNCQKPGYRKIYKKNVSQIKKELDTLTKFSNNFRLAISDDNAFIGIDHITKVLELIKKYKIRWMGPADISISDHPKLLKLIKESGCTQLCFGLESLNPENLRWLAPWKAKFVRTYKERIKKIRDFGINPMGSFLVGLDFDKKSVFQEVIDFFMEANLIAVAAGVLTPYPGTLFRDKLINDKNLDLKAPWTDYTGVNLLYKHPEFTKKEMYDGYMWFLKQVDLPEVKNHIKKVTFI